MKSLVLQYWTETERGWGQRPDGISLHFNQEDRDQYIKDYWERQPDRINGRAPDEYTFPDGDCVRVEVLDVLFTEVMQSEFGKRFYRRPVGIIY